MNNAFFGKTMKNVRKRREIKLITTERRTKLSYFKFFTKNVLAIEIRKLRMNRPVYLGRSILELSAISIMTFGMITQNQNMGKSKIGLYGYR